VGLGAGFSPLGHNGPRFFSAARDKGLLDPEAPVAAVERKFLRSPSPSDTRGFRIPSGSSLRALSLGVRSLSASTSRPLGVSSPRLPVSGFDPSGFRVSEFGLWVRSLGSVPQGLRVFRAFESSGPASLWVRSLRASRISSSSLGAQSLRASESRAFGSRGSIRDGFRVFRAFESLGSVPQGFSNPEFEPRGSIP